ncbi:hypothetical protein [Novosphingobium sp. B1]|uniref:hypothetical protein n=1 Tax=Novosphingobium sp. B1 TaxID=1938756 RepID=UPI000A015BF9|nr:hypothetical protein [Novosphingobium sp. B1]
MSQWKALERSPQIDQDLKDLDERQQSVRACIRILPVRAYTEHARKDIAAAKLLDGEMLEVIEQL